MSELGIFYPTVPSGGGGDLSVAYVTIDCGNDGIGVNGAFIRGKLEATSGYYEANGTETLDLILYKNNASIEFDTNSFVSAEVVSGNATVDGAYAEIHGDCTIRVTVRQ